MKLLQIKRNEINNFYFNIFINKKYFKNSNNDISCYAVKITLKAVMFFNHNFPLTCQTFYAVILDVLSCFWNARVFKNFNFF